MYNYSLMEACRYLTNTNHLRYTQIELINEDAWKKIPAEYQTVVADLMMEGRKRVDAGNIEAVTRIEKDMKEKYNVQFFELDATTLSEIEKISEQVIRENVGVMFDQARLDDLQAALKEYRSKK
jgi:TRAP-type C4-dicarboxylate transport system substrate-binding protein